MSDPLLNIIQGIPTANNNRLADIDQNIAQIRGEFIGMPEVCHALARSIIYLRRNIDAEHHTQCFYSLLGTHRSVLMRNLNVRWLLSICDTIVDVGDVTSSAIAMNIVQCINRCNLDHSLLINAVNGDLDPNRMRQEIKVPTWGGMITADIPSGDMIYNMMCRLDKVVAHDELLNTIWCEIKERSREEPNIVLNHVCAQSRFEHQRRFFQ